MTDTYRAYLIRFQRPASGGHWRATLEDVHSREQVRFATERALLVYLLEALSAPDDAPPLAAAEATPEA